MASRKLATSRDLKALVEVAQRFWSVRPWESVDDIEFVALELPGESEPWFANVLGCAGREFGLYMARGVEGMARMRAWMGVDAADECNVREGVRQVGFTLERWSDLPPGHVARFARAGIALRRDARAPFLMLFEGKEQRPFDARSARRLLLAAAATVAAHPTFIRCDVIDAETGWIEAEDVMTGESVRLHDQALSRTALPGTVLPVALVRVGTVVLPELRGPGLGPIEVDAALAFLEAEGLDISPAGLRSKPHLLGRLWQWRADFHRNASPTQINNTDGDPLEFIELLLRASDPDAVHAAFEARDDVEYDEDDDTFIWSMENDYEGTRAALGDFILLARIQFIGDELLVSVNSRKRADRARAWLEEIPGVRFESREVRSWDDPHETPLDDRPTAEERDREVPPEVLDLVADHMRSYYRRWLDEKIPALGGKTPRQAVRTKQGRGRVALLIRMLDAPSPGLDIKALRAELLDELGLS